MEIRLTAQCAVSNSEAAVAYSVRIEQRGPNGETHSAVLLRTIDEGTTWITVPLQRTFADRFLNTGFPTWPPEAIIELSVEESGFQFVFRDEWVPFEPGGESLWRATQLRNGKWTTARIRFMDYEAADSPASICEVAWQLPTSITPPDNILLNAIFADINQ